jgi:hypothetical protein
LVVFPETFIERPAIVLFRGNFALFDVLIVYFAEFPILGVWISCFITTHVDITIETVIALKVRKDFFVLDHQWSEGPVVWNGDFAFWRVVFVPVATRIRILRTGINKGTRTWQIRLRVTGWGRRLDDC